MEKVVIIGFLIFISSLEVFVAGSPITPELVPHQSASSLIKMEQWADNDDLFDDSTEDLSMQLRELDDEIEEIAVRCGKGGYKKGGKKGGWGR